MWSDIYLLQVSGLLDRKPNPNRNHNHNHNHNPNSNPKERNRESYFDRDDDVRGECRCISEDCESFIQKIYYWAGDRLAQKRFFM